MTLTGRRLITIMLTPLESLIFLVRMSQTLSKSVQSFQSYSHLNCTLEFNSFGFNQVV